MYRPNGPLSKLTKRIYKFLNRPGYRIILGLLASIYSTFRTKRYIRIFYDDSWIHKHSDGVIVDRDIHWAHSISEIISTTFDHFFHIYKPKLGDTVFDIGAGIGGETFVFSKKVGQNGTVVSIEAHPKTFICLTKMCEYNRLKNVIALNLAIIDKESEVFIEDLKNHIKSSVVNKKTGILVRGTTLDKIINDLNINNLDFLKMNIEGAEKMAIKGMPNTVKKTRYICIACHDFIAKRNGREEMKTKNEIIKFLLKNNFKIVSRENDKRDWVRDHIHGINKVLEIK